MGQRRILIVDDEDDIREIAQLSMELGGWGTCTASCGRDAVGVAAEQQPDAVLLDVMTPGLDGPHTRRQLRADPATSAIPVIFLTAKVQLSERRQLRELGAHGLIAKPFDPMVLAQQVTEILDGAA